MVPQIDRVQLTTVAYADNARLAARRRLYAATRPQRDLQALAMRHLPAEARVIVDAGCGDGHYTARIRAERPAATVLPFDLSPGMLLGVPAPRAVADIVRLPLADASVDAVLAMHMLYHVPDPDAALAELRRVLRPGGTLVLSTNSRADKGELRELRAAAVDGLDGIRYPADTTAHFALDDAPARVARHFTDLDESDLHLTAVTELTDPAPAVDHMLSTLAADDAAAVAEAERRATAIVRERIDRDGAYRITNHTGILSARAPS
ncbi:class I SAM-dependent methyltransferase [Mangrovactinospora gilvigrisea]|uniref:class I SAM-dependent methyltransferase n=1 Tax=Mangrovactinospora gilvigrisea TaxID=1428644 RepID=UPI000AE159BA|nr:class I SAM-dependent methyltransferase [Mangrovactinospora gilvigrisea]